MRDGDERVELGVVEEPPPTLPSLRKVSAPRVTQWETYDEHGPLLSTRSIRSGLHRLGGRANFAGDLLFRRAVADDGASQTSSHEEQRGHQ